MKTISLDKQNKILLIRLKKRRGRKGLRMQGKPPVTSPVLWAPPIRLPNECAREWP